MLVLLMMGAFVDVCLLLWLTLWYGCKSQDNSHDGEQLVDLDPEFGHFFEQWSGQEPTTDKLDSSVLVC